MALKLINKIISRLKFLHRTNKVLTAVLRRLLCNTLIQPHFYYALSAGILTSPTKRKTKFKSRKISS